MIGGTDIIIDVPNLRAATALRAAERHLRASWVDAVVQRLAQDDGVHALHTAGLRELMIYRDQAAFESWEQLGADPSNANQMIHLLAEDGSLTIVVDDLDDAPMRALVTELRDLLHRGPWMVSVLARAA